MFRERRGEDPVSEHPDYGVAAGSYDAGAERGGAAVSRTRSPLQEDGLGSEAIHAGVKAAVGVGAGADAIDGDVLAG